MYIYLYIDIVHIHVHIHIPVHVHAQVTVSVYVHTGKLSSIGKTKCKKKLIATLGLSVPILVNISCKYKLFVSIETSIVQV